MNLQRWSKETDLTKLTLKLHEEVGEVTHAFAREQWQQMSDEMAHVSLILDRLRELV